MYNGKSHPEDYLTSNQHINLLHYSFKLHHTLTNNPEATISRIYSDCQMKIHAVFNFDAHSFSAMPKFVEVKVISKLSPFRVYVVIEYNVVIVYCSDISTISWGRHCVLCLP